MSGKSIILDQIAAENSNFTGFPKAREIAYLAQENHFRIGLTVREIIEFVQQLGSARRLALPQTLQRILDIKYCDLVFSDRKILLVYLNLLVDKQLYLFDEPEMGLSLTHSKIIFDWLRTLIKEDKTVILTTNKLDNILDTDNVNFIKNSEEILSDNYLKIKSRMAF
ncbi:MULTISPECIES: ATP-binding cassette domain-containing protein [unclassified Companilactobacillus]|uniref:ATP-binding cassette domain-containing protein n=1 Tax=unclassified Companilactobacillus TaxID=2767904 RepID=UPI002FEEE34B